MSYECSDFSTHNQNFTSVFCGRNLTILTPDRHLPSCVLKLATYNLRQAIIHTLIFHSTSITKDTLGHFAADEYDGHEKLSRYPYQTEYENLFDFYKTL